MKDKRPSNFQDIKRMKENRDTEGASKLPPLKLSDSSKKLSAIPQIIKPKIRKASSSYPNPSQMGTVYSSQLTVPRLLNSNSNKKSYSDENPPIRLAQSPVDKRFSNENDEFEFYPDEILRPSARCSFYKEESPIIKLLKKKNWPKNPNKLSEP